MFVQYHNTVSKKDLYIFLISPPNCFDRDDIACYIFYDNDEEMKMVEKDIKKNNRDWISWVNNNRKIFDPLE